MFAEKCAVVAVLLVATGQHILAATISPADPISYCVQQCQLHKNPRVHYSDPANCHNFYQCVDCQSAATCQAHLRPCPSGQHFDSTVSLTCVPGGCSDTPPTVDPGSGDTEDVCRLEAVPNKPRHFMSGGKMVKCADGTMFNAMHCTCVHGPTSPPGCRAYFHVPFEPATIQWQPLLRDVAGHSWIANNGVVLDSNAIRGTRSGHFDGASDFEVPRFNNFNFGSSFTLTAWVNQLSQTGSKQQLVYNGGCETASLDLHVISAVLHVAVVGSTTVTASTTLTAGTWNMVAVTYDGSTLTLYTSSTMSSPQTVNLSGNVKTTKCPVTVGSSTFTVGNFYSGLLDDLQFFDCALSQAEVLNML